MTYYLVVDALGGQPVVVKGAARRASAVNAVVANRFTACELTDDDIWKLAKADTPLIDLDQPGQSTDTDAGGFPPVTPASEGGGVDIPSAPPPENSETLTSVGLHTGTDVGAGDGAGADVAAPSPVAGEHG